jgi:hypothetical protein
MGDWAMADDLTLAVVQVELVKEGIKFLYGQADEALKRWRERKQAAVETKKIDTVPSATAIPAIFGDNLPVPAIHLSTVARLEPELKQARSALLEYVDEPGAVTLDNYQLLETVDALRRMMEAIYGQRLSFRGEDRPASGPMVVGNINVDDVEGYVAAVRARSLNSGAVRGDIVAKKVSAGGSAVAVDIDRIG